MDLITKINYECWSHLLPNSSCGEIIAESASALAGLKAKKML